MKSIYFLKKKIKLYTKCYQFLQQSPIPLSNLKFFLSFENFTYSLCEKIWSFHVAHPKFFATYLPPTDNSIDVHIWYPSIQLSKTYYILQFKHPSYIKFGSIPFKAGDASAYI